MRGALKKIFFTGFLFILIQCRVYSQNVTVTSANACPNQTVTLYATWNNVGSITYTITKPGGASVVQTSPNFVVSDAGPAPAVIVYTVVGAGQALSGPVTSTTTATLTVNPAPALTLTQANDAYCYGTTATITAPVGSPSYTVTGPAGTGPFTPFNTNVITIPNLTGPYTGQYTVVGNMNGCISTGNTFINVSPNSTLTVNSNSTVCQGAGVLLTATIPNGISTSYVWSSSSLPPTQSQNVTLGALPGPGILPSQSGVYTAAASFSFVAGASSVNCARTNTVLVNVVQTSPVSVQASPSASLCQGANLTLAANVNNVGSPSYSWIGPFFTSTGQSPVITGVVPANSGIYTVTASFTSPGAAISCPTTNTINISITGTTDPNITYPANVCQDASFTMSVSATGATNFSWSGPGVPTSPAPMSSVLSVTNIPANASGVPFFATATFGALGCTRTKSVTINVVPVNTISVYPPADVCQPNSALLNATSVGATSFTWTGPNGDVGYTANTILYYPAVSASGVYTITMGYTSSGLTCINTATTSLTVKPLLNFTITPGAQMVCYNSPVLMSGPAGATSYSWTSSSGYTASTQDINFTSAQPGNSGTYLLTVSLNGCISTGTTELTVLDPIQFTQPFFDRSICRGDSIHMEAHVTGGSQSVYAYSWTPCNSLSACTGSVTDGMPLGTTIYNVQVYDLACPFYTLSASVKVDVNQPPQSHLSLPATEGCAPLCMNYDSNSGPETVWVTYDFGGNLKYQQDSFNVCLKTPGTYTLNVTLTGTNGCSGTQTYPLPIIVNPKPEIAIVTIPESPTITDEVMFTTSSNYAVDNYLWVLPDTSLLPTPLKYFQNAGTYPVYLVGTTNEGCGDTVVKFLEIREDFNVFIPNSFTPNGDGVNDVFNVKGGGILADNFTMEVINRKGQTVYSTRDLSIGWDGTYKGDKAKEDVYVYRIIIIGANSEGKKEYYGQFSLIR